MRKIDIRTKAAVILLALSVFLAGCAKETPSTFSTEQPANATENIADDTSQETKTEASEQPADDIAEAADSENLPDTERQNEPLQDIELSNTEDSPAPLSSISSGSLCVKDARLTDSNGIPVQLKGISTHGLAWFPDYVNRECFRQFKEEWNINVIRLAMYTAESGGYCSGGDQSALKELIKSGVEYATELGMYVIIDWHILSDSNPNTHKDEAKAFFAEMAELYAGYDNVLYEICNEPNGGTSWSDIKSYAGEIIPVIRSYDSDGIIIVGTPNWSQYVDQAAADPITGYENIMYALHFYAATHTDSLRSTMISAINAGLPIFVTEYGICDASGNGAIDENQANQWISAMNEYGISYVAWNLSNKAETSAILSSSCNKTSGFTAEDLSASGKWLYEMLTGTAVPSTPVPTENAPIEDSSASPSPNETIPAEQPDTKPAVSLDSGEIAFTADLVNSWASDGNTFYQYELTLQNNSGKDCTAWSIDVPFSGAITLSDSWNGDYSVSGSTLHITSKDYNGSIPSGGSISNIGFIISGSGNLEIIN